MQKYRQVTPFEIVKELPDTDEIIEENGEEKEENNIDFLLSLVQQLPDRYRLVFNLYVLDNYSHKEIAGLLKISVGTSKSNLSRARGLLKKQLEIHQIKEQKA